MIEPTRSNRELNSERTVAAVRTQKREYNAMNILQDVTKKSSNSPVTIYAGNGKAVGTVKGDIFYKRIQGSKHLLRQPPAIAFDICTLEQAKKAGAKNAKISDTETETTYTAELEHILEHGTRFNRGWGEQIYLPLNGWIKKVKTKKNFADLPLFAGVKA